MTTRTGLPSLRPFWPTITTCSVPVRPSITSILPAFDEPGLDGALLGLAAALTTKTFDAPSVSSSAMRGMVSASARRSNTMPTRENMPGLRSPFGSLTSSVTLKVAVAASTVGATSFTIAGKWRPARASTAIDRRLPGFEPRELALGHDTPPP